MGRRHVRGASSDGPEALAFPRTVCPQAAALAPCTASGSSHTRVLPPQTLTFSSSGSCAYKERLEEEGALNLEK